MDMHIKLSKPNSPTIRCTMVLLYVFLVLCLCIAFILLYMCESVLCV